MFLQNQIFLVNYLACLVDNLWRIYKYVGDGQDSRIVDLRIPKNLKIAFAWIFSPYIPVNNANSKATSSAYGHHVMIKGYESSSQTNELAKFNYDNTLNVHYTANDSVLQGQVVPRTNVASTQYYVITFFE